jgi:hypothetical protein
MSQSSGSPAIPSCTSISTLPEDVLLQIFALCLPHKKFAHVCHDWRILALDCPSLWTEIDFCADVPDSALENLRRARSAPLAVNFCAQDIWKFRSRFSLQDCAGAYLAKLATVRLLRLNCYHAVYTRPILAAHGAAPLLEDLNILFRHSESSSGGFSGWDEGLETDDPDHIELGADFLHGEAPRLQRLTLEKAWIAPAWPPFAHLRHLSFRGVSKSQNQAAYDVLQLLHATPRLETLVSWEAMSSIWDVSADDRLATLPAVPLRHLRCLELHEYPAGLADFVSCITDVPATARVLLEGGHVYGGDQAAQTTTTAIFDALAAHVAACRQTFVESTAAIAADNSIGAGIKVWAASETLPWLSVTAKDTPPPLLFRNLERVIPLGDLSHLMVLLNWQGTVKDAPISAEEWTTVLARMTRVSKITVYYSQRAQELCKALRLSIQPSGDRICPSLQCLVLHRVKLRQPKNSPLLTLLPDVVLARRNAGVPLKTLKLRHIQHEGVAAVRSALVARMADVEVCSDEGWRGRYRGMELWPDGEWPSRQGWTESHGTYSLDTYHTGTGFPRDCQLIDGVLNEWDA